MEPIRTVGFLMYIKYFFLTLFVIFILIEVVIDVYKYKSLTPILKDLGGQFFLVTQNLDNASKEIIQQGVIYTPSLDFWNGIWDLFKTLSYFFTAFYIMYIWIKLLSTIFAFIFFSGNKGLGSTFIALIVFIGLQSFFIISVSAIEKNVDCFSGCEKSVSSFVLTPLMCFYDFIKASLVLLEVVPQGSTDYIYNLSLNSTQNSHSFL